MMRRCCIFIVRVVGVISSVKKLRTNDVINRQFSQLCYY